MPDKPLPNTEPPPSPEENKNKDDDFRLPEDQMSAEAKLLQDKNFSENKSIEESVFAPPAGLKSNGQFITQELKNIPPPTNPPAGGPPGIPKIPKFKPPKKVIFGLVGVLVLIMVTFVLLSFGKNQIGPPVNTKGDITWWGITLEPEVVNPLIQKYQEQNPNVRIKYIKQSTQDYRERLTSALASGTGPDMFEMHNTWLPMFSEDLFIMPNSVMSQDEFARTFYPVVSASLSTADGVAGMPLEYDALTLYINEDIFTSAAKQPPTTWNDLLELAKFMTRRDERDIILQSGAAIGTTTNIDYWREIIALMMMQNGVNLANPTGDRAEDALAFFVQFDKEHEVWDETLPPSINAFATNKLAMYFATANSATELKKLNPNLRYRTIPLPQLAKEDPNQPDYSYANFWVQGVWNRSSNNELAWDLLKYLSSPESLQEMNAHRKSINLMEKAYPRPDMAILQTDHKILGSIVSMGNVAKTWYLVSDTYDGETGINTQISRIYETAIDTARERERYKEGVEVLASIKDVLTKYGIK